MFKKILVIIVLGLALLPFLFAEKVVINPHQTSSVTIDIIESTDDYTVIEFSINHFTKETITIEGVEYFTLSLPSQALRLDEGYPELPLVGRGLMIPPQAKMKVEVLNNSYLEFSGSVLPSKGSLSRQIDPATVPFTFSDIYSTDSFYPENIAELGEAYIMREIRGIPFRITPFAVNPVQNIIRYYDTITIKVYADGLDTENIMPHRSSRITNSFVDLYKNHFLNYQQSQSRYDIIPETGTMLVICHADFLETIQPFVQWKNQKGIPTTVINVATIGTTAASIQTYIANYFAAHPELSYVHLVGDQTKIPTLTQTTDGVTNAGMDPRYGMILPNSDTNYPDIFISRFSGNSVAHIQTQVERSIYYERDITEGQWLNKATGIGGAESGGHFGESDKVHIENIRQLLLNTGTYDTVDAFYQGNSPTFNTANLTAAFNEGRAMINYLAHGDYDGWYFQGGYGSPSGQIYHINHVNDLTNMGMLPVIFSVACQNGNFSNYATCYAEAWLRATHNSTGQPTGAIAVYGGSINQPWHQPMYAQDHAMVLLTSRAISTIGSLFFSGSMYMMDVSPHAACARSWNIFGDASMQFRTASPTVITVNATDSINLQDTSYEVMTDTPNALVCLYNPSLQEIVSFAYADNMGTATLSFDPISDECCLLLTITGFDKITHIQEVSVVEQEMLPPGQVMLQSPENNAISVPLNQALLWSEPSGTVIGYQLYFCQEGNEWFDPILLESWTFCPYLEYGTTYNWKVSAYNSSGEGESSQVWSFTTKTQGELSGYEAVYDFGRVIVGDESLYEQINIMYTLCLG
ncbi:MAG: C25 family cysteine peptidase [Candidatus Cloacimonetes bacterium]|nr:C25 family cysteine peptidase [Candidatus Cloacimonadota bacterium]